MFRAKHKVKKRWYPDKQQLQRKNRHLTDLLKMLRATGGVTKSEVHNSFSKGSLRRALEMGLVKRVFRRSHRPGWETEEEATHYEVV